MSCGLASPAKTTTACLQPAPPLGHICGIYLLRVGTIRVGPPQLLRCIFSRDCAAHQHNTEFKQQHLHGRKAKLNCKASSKSITQSKSILLATGNQHSSRQQRLHSSSKNDNGSNGNPSCSFRAQACLLSCLSVGLLSKIQTEALGAVARSPP